jgi:hypothetical protein
MHWSTFFESGGWGMYPTSLFGFFLIAGATIYLVRPEPRFMHLALAFGVMTLASGVLGFSVGLVTTFNYLRQVPREEQLAIAGLGVGESLHNVILALMLVILSTLIAAAGIVRGRLLGRGSVT